MNTHPVFDSIMKTASGEAFNPQQDIGMDGKPIYPSADILEKLVDLHKQATIERSHFYVASCIKEAMEEIAYLRLQLRTRDRATDE